MADNEEILKYSIDKGQAERALGELIEKQKQVTEGQAAGRDTSALEQDIDKETSALARLTTQQRKGGDATGDLLRQKEKLGAVVRTLGGSFSGLTGDVGGVVELLLSGSKAAIGFGAGLAVVSLAAGAYQKFAAAAREAAEAQERLNRARLEEKNSRIDSQTAVRDELERLGRLDKFNAALILRDQLQSKFGFDEQRAGRAAVLGAVGELSVEEAARLSVALVMGARVETGEQARALFEAESDETRRDREAALKVIRGSEAGREEASTARRRAGVLITRDAAERLFRSFGGDNPEGIENPEDIREAERRSRELEGKIERLETGEGFTERAMRQDEAFTADRLAKWRDELEKLRQIVRLLEQERRLSVAAADPGAVSGFVRGAARQAVEEFNEAQNRKAAQPGATDALNEAIEAGPQPIGEDIRGIERELNRIGPLEAKLRGIVPVTQEGADRKRELQTQLEQLREGLENKLQQKEAEPAPVVSFNVGTMFNAPDLRMRPGSGSLYPSGIDYRVPVG